MTKIYQEDVSSFCLEVHDFLMTHPMVYESDEEGFDHLAEFIEQRFDKFWPHLYTGEYQNYN